MRLPRNLFAVCFWVFVVLLPVFATAEPSSFEFDLVISSMGDQRAVLRDQEGRMSVVRTGDVVPNTNFTVKQILGDRILLADASTNAGLNIKDFWLFKVSGGGQRSVQEPAIADQSAISSPTVNIVTRSDKLKAVLPPDGVGKKVGVSKSPSPKKTQAKKRQK